MVSSPTEPHLHIEALRRWLQREAPGQPVELIETHISWVLLAGERAYKVKKPVKMGFLDFSTRDARHRACLEELRLNQRLAPGLYIAVVPITGTPLDPRFTAEGEPIDYAVRMRRFPSGGLFSERLEAGQLQVSEVDRLAECIADFHLAAPVADVSSPYGTPQVIESTTMQVLASLDQHEGASALAGLRAWWRAQSATLRPVWEARRREGRVREGHGDLHLANATLFEGDVVAFDCIEFDPELRWIDVMSDVAFAVMDFMAHGRRDLAFRFLDGWLERTGDHGGLAVLPSYLVYRALVRALVARLRRVAEPGAPDYLALACRMASEGVNESGVAEQRAGMGAIKAQSTAVARATASICNAEWAHSGVMSGHVGFVHTFSPSAARLLITHGVSGSGKTYMTQRLLEQVGAIRLRSDVERKRLFGLRPLERSDPLARDSLYSTEATRRTYDTLLDKARQSLRAGFPTIVDAAFLRRHERADFERLARELGAPCTILHSRADPAVLRERIERRLAGQRDASEADLAVLERQLEFQEALTADEQRRAIEVDTRAGADLTAVGASWLAATAVRQDTSAS
jgi:aminoglycoside phosphotransferase family enzyme/predicted kinase